MSTVHSKDMRLDAAAGKATGPVRLQQKYEAHGEPGDAQTLPPLASLLLLTRPASRREARPLARSASHLLLPPPPARVPPTLGVRMCSMVGPRLQGTGRRAITHLHAWTAWREERGAGTSLPGAGGCGAWLRLQVRRRPRTAGTWAGGARAALERESLLSCHLPCLHLLASSPAEVTRARGARSFLKGAAIATLWGVCSSRHNRGLVLGVALWRRDGEYAAAAHAHRLHSRASRAR